MGRPPISEEEKVRTTTDIPKSQSIKLEEAAKKEGVTVASLLRKIIYLFLQEK